MAPAGAPKRRHEADRLLARPPLGMTGEPRRVDADPFRRVPSHFEDANGCRVTDIVSFKRGLEPFTGAMAVIMVHGGYVLGASGVVTALSAPIMPPIGAVRRGMLSIMGRIAGIMDREVAIMVGTAPVRDRIVSVKCRSGLIMRRVGPIVRTSLFVLPRTVSVAPRTLPVM